jgi:hypothetical protein
LIVVTVSRLLEVFGAYAFCIGGPAGVFRPDKKKIPATAEGSKKGPYEPIYRHGYLFGA